VYGEGASVHGAVFSFLQVLRFLPWHLDGIGVLANVTLLKSKSKIATREGETFPLIDQADVTYSVGLSYEKFGFSGRIIGTSRGKHLKEVTDKRPEDVYADERVVWNLSASYNISRTWSLFADFLNLTDSPFRQYTGYPHVPATNNYYGRTYNCGVKARF
jgi:outer membrane receptor protein involved in Fe transport